MFDKLTGKAAGTIGVTKFLGFESVSDFIKSLFGVQYALVVTPASIIGGVSYFITKYIWDSPEAIYTLCALMVADWITGIAKSVKMRKFDVSRVVRIPVYFIVTHFLIGISWNMAKGNALFGFLPGMVFIGFCSVYFVSIVQNLVYLNLLPKELAVLIEKKASLKSIFKKNNDS
jgi:hypothetical protein